MPLLAEDKNPLPEVVRKKDGWERCQGQFERYLSTCDPAPVVQYDYNER